MGLGLQGELHRRKQWGCCLDSPGYYRGSHEGQFIPPTREIPCRPGDLQGRITGSDSDSNLPSCGAIQVDTTVDHLNGASRGRCDTLGRRAIGDVSGEIHADRASRWKYGNNSDRQTRRGRVSGDTSGENSRGCQQCFLAAVKVHQRLRHVNARFAPDRSFVKRHHESPIVGQHRDQHQVASNTNVCARNIQISNLRGTIVLKKSNGPRSLHDGSVKGERQHIACA
mmetsp:Transcript_43178/g.94020  ORF Transcript_43178/g.94020 Transcript_43178/m.94020 type:complete len:226 (-) Transcript_43178:825-1502(-)